MLSSPGLRRKLLPTELRRPVSSNSTFYTSNDTDSVTLPAVSLTRPRPYSPPMQKRIRPTHRANKTITKPGNPDVQTNVDVPNTTHLSNSTFYTPSVVVTSDVNQGQGQNKVIEPGGHMVPSNPQYTGHESEEREPAFV